MPVKATPESILKICKVHYYVPGEGQWFQVKCIFHAGDSDDVKEAHGRIHPEKGIYQCFICKHTTSIINYVARVYNTSIQVIEASINGALGNKNTIPVEMIGEYHASLVGNTELMHKMLNKHGITFDDINKYKLGAKGQTDGTFRVTIPIVELNEVKNVLQYSYSDKVDKMKQMKGATNCLYLRDNIASSTEVFIAEGPFKAILLNRMGFNAISPTLGASNWDVSWNELFKDKDVIIVYDCDKAGQRGAAMLCKELKPHAKTVRSMVMPLSGQDWDKDVTDYFVKRKFTADDFRKLAINTTEFAAPVKPSEDNDDPKVYDARLNEASTAKLYDKRVKFSAIVAAKDTTPYIIPYKAQVICEAAKEYCINCHVADNRYYEFEISADDKRIADLVSTPVDTQKEVLKKISGVYHGCKACTFKTLESRNVEELRLIPQISVGHSTGEMVERKAYAIGHGLETNTAYDFTARVCADTKTQYASLVAYHQQKAVDDINEFKLTHDLTLYQPADWSVEGVRAKLDDIYEDLENNVTKIYQRRDLHLFYDLAFHSVLYAPFQGKLIKGWLDVLCIGDSGQGKSETSIRLMQHYNVGERVDTKRASLAGIMGGCVASGDRWFIRWGTIPLQDRRLAILEECKGASVETLGALTDMRSSGIAEIQKIERQRTNARTRLIWISNPRSDRTIGSYNYGVDAVKELIGSLEDIRRFDMVMAVAKDTVSMAVINKPQHLRQEVAHHYTSELSSHLIMWAWSRTESQIHYEEGFETELLNAATRIGTTYSSSCPIVEPADQRYKLLRLATALAARTFSTDDGENLIVRRSHILLVEEFLDRIYKDKALGYYEFSMAQKGETIIRDPKDVEKRLIDMPNASDSINTLIETDAITFQVIIDCTEWMKDQSNEFIGFLVRKQCLKALRRGGYRKTSAFIELLKQLDRQGVKSETLHEKLQNGDI